MTGILLAVLLIISAAAGAGEGGIQVKTLPGGNLFMDGITLRREAGELAFPGEFVLKRGTLEAVVVQPHGRLHEALLKSSISAMRLQTMLYLLGAENGSRLPGKSVEQGTLVDVFIEYESGGMQFRKPVECWMKEQRTGKPLQPRGWVFVGSTVKNGDFLADKEGNLVLNYSAGATILDFPEAASAFDDTLHTVNENETQPEGQVAIVLKIRKSGGGKVRTGK